MISPLGNEVYSESYSLESIEPGEEQIIVADVNIPEIIFGEYTLSYEVIYDDKERAYTTILPNCIKVNAETDKAFYSEGDALIIEPRS